MAIFYQVAFNPPASPFSSIALLLVVISLLVIFIGLAVSATDLERRVSTFFAIRGWTAQRDDAGFKVFVRRPQLSIGLLIVLLLLGVVPALIYLLAFAFRRSEAVLIEIGSTVAGARIQMQGPWSAVRPFYRSLDLDAPRLSPFGPTS